MDLEMTAQDEGLDVPLSVGLPFTGHAYCDWGLMVVAMRRGHIWYLSNP
jgi:hypothetical protein